MGLKIHTIHHKSAVAQKSQLPLLIQLLQDMLAVLGEIHGWGKSKETLVRQRRDIRGPNFQARNAEDGRFMQVHNKAKHYKQDHQEYGGF